MSDTATTDGDDIAVSWHDEEFLCRVLRSLSTGDEIRVNERTRPITVVETGNLIDGHGSDYPYYEVELEGNGTTYTIRVSDGNRTALLDYPSNTGICFVRDIEVAGSSSVIVSDVSADEFVTPTVETVSAVEQSLRENRPESADRDELAGMDVIGECPECDSAVVDDGERAVCWVGCGEWCWIEEWEAYHARE